MLVRHSDGGKLSTLEDFARISRPLDGLSATIWRSSRSYETDWRLGGSDQSEEEKMSDSTSNLVSRTWAMTGALVFGCVAVTVLLGLYAWQIDQHDSKAEEAEQHAQAAVYLQEAAAGADVAGELIVAYVTEGDEALVPEIQHHSESAIAGITNALSASSSDEVSAIAREGTSLAEGAGQIIALRQSGKAEQAAATLEEFRGSFDAFGTALNDATNSEFDAAASLLADSDTADQKASWLLITAAVVAAAICGGLLLIVTSALRRRGVSETPTPA